MEVWCLMRAVWYYRVYLFFSVFTFLSQDYNSGLCVGQVHIESVMMHSFIFLNMSH